MKESVAKTKICPELSKMAATQNLSAMLLHVIAVLPSGNSTLMGAAVKQIGEIVSKNNNSLCTGSGCVMWEPEYEKESKELKPDEESPGDDWIKKQRIAGQPNVVWVRFVPIDQGDCGLKTKETGCFYPG